jgi:carbamoyl-phosphate synthase large subunit
MTKVLITGAGALLGQEIFHSLKHTLLFPNLFIGFADPSRFAVGLHWADATHFLPMASSDDYIDSLIDILRTNAYEFLIPGTDVELPKISVLRDEIEASTGCKVIVSPRDVVDIANDKYLTSSFLGSNQFSPPRSWTSAGLTNEDINFLPYPLIVKPRNGARSIGVLKVDEPAQLLQAVLATENPVIQECIGSTDDEFTAGSIAFGGKCYSTILLKRTLRDGNTWTAQVVNDISLQDYISKITEALNPYGPCNFQFRLDSSGLPRVFEINARFSGTTYMRALSGFDEVAWSLIYARDGFMPDNIPVSFGDYFFMRSFAVTSVPSSLLSF